MTMPRFFASAIMSATLMATPLLPLRAETGTEADLPLCCCAYNMWTCTYNDGSYWDGCDPRWESGQLWTFMAKARCGNWHAAS